MDNNTNTDSSLDKQEMREEINEEINEKMSADNDDMSDRKRYRERKNKDRKNKKKLSPLAIVLIVILSIIVILLAAFFIITGIGKSKLSKSVNEDVEMMDNNGNEVTDRIVDYNGKKYKYNDNLINILFMGIDVKGELEKHTELGKSGQADSIFLCSIDTSNGAMNIISIPRDTMTDVNVYSGKEGFVGTKKLQVCLAYGYGDGREVSSENTTMSVSRLMYGVPINSYVSISLAAIPILNDAVGGVTVTIPEEYTAYDKSVTAGQTVTLMGQKAEFFVRARDSESGDMTANTYRIERQKTYLLGFISKFFSETKKDISLPLTMYGAIGDYVCTDLDTTQIAYLSTQVIKNGFSGYEIKSIPYEIKMGEYAEYHAKNQELFDMIIDLFYEPVN